MPDLDWEIRLAAFDALGRVTARSGGVIRRAEMAAGFEFRGERIPFALRAKGIWKPRQVSAALSLTTAVVRQGVQARYDDQLAGDGDWIEYAYQDRGPEDADNRAVRRAFDQNRPLIYFYGLVPGVFEAIYPVFVASDDRARHTFRIVADARTVSPGMLSQGGSPPLLKAYTTRLVKERVHQDRFRLLVLAAYQVRCATGRRSHSPRP
jgi:putative restriction endonuclease